MILLKDTFKKKLFYRVLSYSLPFLIFSIVATSAIISLVSYDYFKKSIHQDYQNIIKGSAGEIRLYMESAQKEMESLAWVINATKLDRRQKEMALVAFNHIHSEFASVSLISAAGEKVASAGMKAEDAPITENEIFKKALKGENGFSKVVFSKQNIPYVNIAVPVVHLGEVVEILWAELNLKSVWDILESVRIGRTGQVYITDLSGRMIGHRDIERVIKALPVVNPEVFERLAKVDTPLEWTEQRGGTDYYCLGYMIPSLRWVIVLNQDKREIYTYLYQNLLGAALSTLLTCIAATLLGWYGVKQFLTPIQTMHHQVQKIGRGDLDQKVPVSSQDEVGDLATAFNEMTDSLRKFIAREVETAKELVHTKNLAVLGTTSAKVAHEVGNLLNNIGMTLATLKREPLSPLGQRSVEILEKDSVRVRGFITNFLQFAKKPDLHLEKVTLDRTIKEVMHTHQSGIKGRDIVFNILWKGDLPSVSMDTRLMYQVINNLVKNSLEAMADSGSITIEGRMDGEYLQTLVKDTGMGMDSQIAGQIFDPFFTTKGKKGTGLGLSICKTILEAHRGTIECQSEVGKGTTFILRLPLL